MTFTKELRKQYTIIRDAVVSSALLSLVVRVRIEYSWLSSLPSNLFFEIKLSLDVLYVLYAL